MKIETKEFGLGATLITLTNQQNIALSFTNLGARVVDWNVSGKHIVLGFDSAQEYLEKDSYPGATIGRTAGRIKDGIVQINGKDIQLNQNEFPQNLHGGEDAFNLKLWRFETFNQGTVAGIHFYLTSNDGENGYSGKLDVTVTHSFDENGKWEIEYEAISDKETVFNPTGHVYFNLNGDVSIPIDNHKLELAASRFVALKDKTEIVRGDISGITQDFDFREGKLLEETFAGNSEQLILVGGIDHPFLLDEVILTKEQARLSLDDVSVSVYTDRPSIVIFTANFGDLGTIYRGKAEANHGGITFECQVAPGSEQIPELGNIQLQAGEHYHATTIYKLNGEK
ncbi:galactose-1-epimerase [Lactococcus nasutitermitis]|uniref:Aldose 1-epimerase n=1 Tax=Lactococcus nasutitermitis TaxID=1652957 RepID=A0ABV9JBI3_9LACT|nr:galactose-1-epimerase [Lactococcus nasutitermitis]